jgi:hypothetical protein
LSRGSSPCGCPHEPLVSYQINRQLSGWNLPPLVMRAFGALCQFRTPAPQQNDMRGCTVIRSPLALEDAVDGVVRSRREDRGLVYLAVVHRKLDEQWLSPRAPHEHVRVCVSCLEWNRPDRSRPDGVHDAPSAGRKVADDHFRSGFGSGVHVCNEERRAFSLTPTPSRILAPPLRAQLAMVTVRVRWAIADRDELVWMAIVLTDARPYIHKVAPRFKAVVTSSIKPPIPIQMLGRARSRSTSLRAAVHSVLARSFICHP